MQTKVFRYRWLFWIAILLHSISVLGSFFAIMQFRRDKFEAETFLYIILFLALNILIVVALFEKFRRTILLINLTFIPIFLWFFLMVLWNILHDIFSIQSFKKSIIIGLYLILINKYKYKNVDNEIDEIGQNGN